MNGKKPKAIMNLLLGFSLFVAFCSLFAYPSDAQSSSPRNIIIGAVFDLTGQGAERGREARDALLLEEDRINQGKDKSSPRVLVVTIDSAGKPEVASQAVKKLAIDYKALAIIGPTERKSALEAAREVNKYKVPLIALAAPEALLRPVRPWVFSTAYPTALAVRRMLLDMRERSIRRAAILVPDNGFGSEGRENLAEIAPEMGISILLNDRHDENEQNLIPYLQKANSRGVEVFVHWAEGPARLALVRAKLALDIKLPVYMALVLDYPSELRNPGRSLEGTTFPAPRVLVGDLLPKSAPGVKRIREFRDAFQNQFGRFPDSLAGSAADAMRILQKAMKKGDHKRRSIRAILESMGRYDGLSGEFRFSKTDHNGLASDALEMVRIKGGKWVLETEKKKGGQAATK